ncbi:MAG TPA: sodium:solute symporter family protein [Thermoanaerobacterales bacterium]|nr:sodium:solute symporter family protein [Thermoanaerobacterales bacterium]
MIYLWAIIIYLIGLLLVGTWFYKKIEGSKSFMMADRGLPWWVNSGTMVATYIGAGSLIGGSALAYKVGLSAVWMDAGGFLAVLALVFIADKIRNFEGYSTPDILGVRFNNATRLVASLIIIAAETAIVGYQMKAGGYVLNVAAGIDPKVGTIISAIFIIGYTMIAGLLSVAYTDLIQGVTIILSLLIGLPFVLQSAGGLSSFLSHVSPDKVNIFGGSFYDAMKVMFPTFCLVFVMQPLWQRIFASKNIKESRIAVIVSLPAIIFIVFVLVFTATVGAELFPGINGDSIIMHVAKNALPPLVGIIMLAAAVAIIVSTGDSMLLSPATNIIHDIYQTFINPKADDRRVLLYTRLTVLILGLLAYIQVQFFPSILAMVIYAYTMEGGLAPALIASFFWKRATAAGGFACVLSAGIITIVWEALKQPFGIGTVFPTIFISTAVLIIVSLLTPPPEESKLSRFFPDTFAS